MEIAKVTDFIKKELKKTIESFKGYEKIDKFMIAMISNKYFLFKTLKIIAKKLKFMLIYVLEIINTILKYF